MILIFLNFLIENQTSPFFIFIIWKIPLDASIYEFKLNINENNTNDRWLI